MLRMRDHFAEWITLGLEEVGADEKLLARVRVLVGRHLERLA
jgi:hypothetical protein